MKLNIASLDLSKFGYVIAKANICDKHDRSTPSHYHWKILKCRMLIFSSSSILASPDTEDLQQVHIVFSKSGDNFDKLISLFLQFSLIQDGGIRTTTPEIFQICFRYTMNARIAPLWNTLGENYLINNRDFLITKGPQDGVSYNVLVNDKNILSMEIKAVKINLLNTETFMPGQWIRVLPSLNKAMIEEHYETLPQISKFRCYKDLRRHWKNIHGYRLPEGEGFYYSIQFWRGEPLLYPRICVIRNFPIITPTPQSLEKVIVQNFLNCLNLKMSNFLGAAITLQNVEDGNDNDLDSNKHYSPDTQAVSLCTPTQSTK
ncbi:unnamed protein product [Arctia plantaginis]|uniref:DUF4708 domain-containing protein n=1 Tax=Arctia plantaginis TaxID=874455 RepID=A0A8S0ZFS6_ARCPL|nr:unnamed protein product [Arctia plantaginis]